MEDEELLDEMIADIVSGLVDKSDEEIQAELDKEGLPKEWQDELWQNIREVRAADDEAAKLPQNADFAAEAEADAQKMADEDDTSVEVTEEDSDGDGDTDKKTVEKESTEDDSEKDNASESGDKPHDSENSTNNIAKTLSSYRW